MHSVSFTHTHTSVNTHPYVKAQVPPEKDFVNVNAIQRWQQAVSAVKWALCWAECNDSQDNWSRIWNGFHFVVTRWGRVTGGLASERWRALQGGVLSSPCLRLSSLPPVRVLPRISTPAFLFMPSPLLNCSGILVLSEPWVRGPARLFLVIPAFLASGIYLQKAQAPRQSSRL